MRTPSRVLIVPGWENSGPDHWQTLWERADPRRFRRVEQRDWDTPRPEDWIRELDTAIAAEPAPAVLVAHSLGCIAIAHWAARCARPACGGRRGWRRYRLRRETSARCAWSAAAA